VIYSSECHLGLFYATIACFCIVNLTDLLISKWYRKLYLL